MIKYVVWLAMIHHSLKSHWIEKNRNLEVNPADKAHAGAKTAELPKNPRDQSLEVFLGTSKESPGVLVRWTPTRGLLKIGFSSKFQVI